MLNIAHVVRPPVVDTPNHQAALGVPLSFQIQATDLDAGTTLTYSAINLPSGATINAQTGAVPVDARAVAGGRLCRHAAGFRRCRRRRLRTS